MLAVPAVALVMAACVNGKVERGTRVDMDTLPPRDTVSTITLVGSGFMLAENMQSASYRKFFNAEVDIYGHVSGQFNGIEEASFPRIFDAGKCPHGKIEIQNAEGRCRGVAILNEGAGVNPILLMLMEDDHAERISLYDLSTGVVHSTERTSQEGIVSFELGDPTENGGTPIVGVAIDGSKISLDWESL